MTSLPLSDKSAIDEAWLKLLRIAGVSNYPLWSFFDQISSGGSSDTVAAINPSTITTSYTQPSAAQPAAYESLLITTNYDNSIGGTAATGVNSLGINYNWTGNSGSALHAINIVPLVTVGDGTIVSSISNTSGINAETYALVNLNATATEIAGGRLFGECDGDGDVTELIGLRAGTTIWGSNVVADNYGIKIDKIEGATNNYALFAITETGNFNIDNTGKLHFTGTTDACSGKATLVAGQVVVNTTAVTVNSHIFLTHTGSNVTNLGTVYYTAVVAGTSFTIKSSNASDIDTIDWFIIN